MKNLSLILLTIFLCCGFFTARSENIYADARKSKACAFYEIPTSSGEYLCMEVFYSDETKNAHILDVQFYPKKSPPDGESTYYLVDKYGFPKIRATFLYKGKQLQWGRFEEYAISGKASGDTSNLEIIKSRLGYDIVFEFHYKGQNLLLVKVFPRINAFDR